MTCTEANVHITLSLYQLLFHCKIRDKEKCGIYTGMPIGWAWPTRDRLIYATINNITIVCIECVCLWYLWFSMVKMQPQMRALCLTLAHSLLYMFRAFYQITIEHEKVILFLLLFWLNHLPWISHWMAYSGCTMTIEECPHLAEHGRIERKKERYIDDICKSCHIFIVWWICCMLVARQFIVSLYFGSWTKTIAMSTQKRN